MNYHSYRVFVLHRWSSKCGLSILCRHWSFEWIIQWNNTRELWRWDCYSFLNLSLVNTSIHISFRSEHRWVPIPLHWCCLHHCNCTLATCSRGNTTVQAPSGVPAGLGQLVGDPPVLVLHDIHICVCNSLPLCLQLAVADRCCSGIPELDWTYIISSKMACDRSLYSDVHQYYPVFSEDCISCFVAGDCICSGILHAVLWTWWGGKYMLHIWTIRVQLIVMIIMNESYKILLGVFFCMTVATVSHCETSWTAIQCQMQYGILSLTGVTTAN